jgi:hypothetical protein
MTTYPMKQFSLPEWTNDLPDTTNLAYKDIAKIFGCKPCSVPTMVVYGYIPNPDNPQRLSGRFGSPRNKTRIFWTLGYLRRLAKTQPS